MNKLKCESCKFYKHWTDGDRVRCMSREVAAVNKRFLPLHEAREICNKEGDGVFVYFESRDPGGLGVGLEVPKAMAATA